ncbi:keratin-associated protein 4-3-like [Lineus longissimus]|uniref:keratin-associated protein 4-3-like n=1 Tax=Lineus longissimus TaxID=88925 RepID=UPI00315D8942
MAGYFTRNTLILVAILVAGLPSVAPYDYNTCSGGFFHETCRVPLSSHCCKSGIFLSATCCRNFCSYPGFIWSTSTRCFFITDSMCCSKSRSGSESCCNAASYSRTSSSSVNGYYTRSTFATCHRGIYSTDYCTNSLSTGCCGYGTSASCCRPSTCVGRNWRGILSTCSGSSTYCCSSSKSCCDSSGYDHEQRQKSYEAGAVAGGVIGGIILLAIIIVVPVSVVCCCRANGAREAIYANQNADATVVAVTSTSNQTQPNQPYQAYQPPPSANYQPPPYGYNPPPVSNNQ